MFLLQIGKYGTLQLLTIVFGASLIYGKLDHRITRQSHHTQTPSDNRVHRIVTSNSLQTEPCVQTGVWSSNLSFSLYSLLSLADRQILTFTSSC